MDKSKRSEKKSQFQDAYAANGMNISAACKTVGINRETVRKWLLKESTNKAYDPDFATAMADIDESFNDLAEHQVKARVEKGEWIALRYWLENRAPHRWRRDNGPIPVEICGQSTLQVQLTKVIDGQPESA
jgi:transposase-like protein